MIRILCALSPQRGQQKVKRPRRQKCSHLYLWASTLQQRGPNAANRLIWGHHFYHVTWSQTQKNFKSNQSNLMDSLKTNDQNRYNKSRDIAFVICFSKTGTYITHNAIAIKWHHWRKCIRLNAASSEARKIFIPLFFPTYSVVLFKTCKHTLLCKIGWVTL